MSATRRARFVAGLRDDHALARGQTVGLDHHRQSEPLQRRQRLPLIGAPRIGGGGDVRAVAQRLGKCFRSLQLRGGARGAEHSDALAAQAVGKSIDQRCFRPNHDQIDRLASAEADNRRMIRHVQRHARRAFGDAGVARAREQFAKAWALCQFPCQRMFAPASAQQQDVHGE